MPNSAVLLCPGASFDPDELPSLHSLGDVYTVNRSLRAYVGRDLKPVAAFLMDKASEFETEQALIQDDSITKYVRGTRTEGYPASNVVKVSLTKPCLGDPFSAAHLDNQNIALRCKLLTTLVGWQVLVLKGYERVYIVGADCRIGERVYFCDHDDEDYVTRRKRSAYGKVYAYLKQWYPYALRRGTQTVNLSEGSRLSNWMPSMSVEKALEEEGKR